jgi:hypothetical protein
MRIEKGGYYKIKSNGRWVKKFRVYRIVNISETRVDAIVYDKRGQRIGRKFPKIKDFIKKVEIRVRPTDKPDTTY